MEQILVSNAHEPLVSREDYAKVQERLNRRAKAAHNHGYEKTFFAGLVKCGKCGYACNHVLYHRQPADKAYIECNKRKTKECDLLPIRELELKGIMEQIAGCRENVERITLFDGHIDFLMKDGTVKSHIRKYSGDGFNNENAVFQQNKSLYKIIQKRKQQKNPEMAEYIIMGNYARLKGSMMRLLSQCYPGEDMQYHAYLPYAQDKTISIMPILKLLEIMDLASYDLKGGENAEIFLRVNDPEKIKRLAYSNYQNEVLKEIKRKHRDSQELLKQFFTCPMGDVKRWNFIESYFLGREEELETYLMESSGNC